MAQHPDSGKARRWLQFIRRWQQSRLGVREFCRCRRLSEASFYAWRRVLRQRGLLDLEPSADNGRAASTPAFVKVEVHSSASALSAIEVVLTEGRRLCVRPGFDPDLLRQLVRLLEEPSC